MPKPSSTLRDNPDLWEFIVQSVKEGSQGGAPGQWSARKAQRAVLEYKKAGGSYLSERSDDHPLTRWTNPESPRGLLGKAKSKGFSGC